MNSRETQEHLLPTPFISSYVARARPGDLFQADFEARAAAWAHWSITSLAEMSGMSERSYFALTLSGQFYDPKGRGPAVRPHLEIRESLLQKPAPEFPDRLALMGNTLAFPWWVFSEVTALRRALFTTTSGDLLPTRDVLIAHHQALVQSVVSLSKSVQALWPHVESALVTDPDGMAGLVATDFLEEEIAEFFPAALELGLSAVFDEKLREKSKSWVARRVGVWQMHSSRDRANFGVVTPRLTSNSLFRDPLFTPATESPAALLVRGLLLRRLVTKYAGSPVAPVLSEQKSVRSVAFLRAQPAREGAKLPRASVEGAIAFLQTFPDTQQAWELLEEWANKNQSALTVTEKGFKASHANALRYLRRAEDPERDDIDVVLPIAWNDGKVVRVTFTRATE